MKDNRLLTDIAVEYFDDDGQMNSLQLTPSVWERSLVRGPWRHYFAQLWERYTISTAERHAAIARLCESQDNFTQSCLNFIHDLRTFGGRKDSRTRLEGTGHEFYLGKPYFESTTVDTILQMKAANGTVEDQLRALADKTKGEMCAAHDLSPFFESVLGISWDKERKSAMSSQHLMSQATISTEGNKLKKLAHKSSKIFSAAFSRKRGGGRGGRSGHGGSSSSVA